MASKKEYATRFSMGILAVLFLVTSVGFSLLVIWQTKQQNKQEAIQQGLAETQADTNKGENTLQGTLLTNFTPITKVDSLQSTDTVVGTGDVVKPGDTITAHYTGAVASTGVIFQSSHDGANQPVPFSLSGVIKGWTDGVPGMKVGGTRRLLIPADLAYGATPPAGSGIPADAGLVFDIELVKIGQ
jgi:FKBP-type peptidyl-prolyl cis-trans isomerase